MNTEQRLADTHLALAEAYLAYMEAWQEEIGPPTEEDWAAADRAIEEHGITP